MATPTIVTCACGARVRLPEQTQARSFRCPKCKTAFATTLDAQIIATYQAQAGDLGAMCPICQSPIGETEVIVACPKCGQIHHRECWVEVGGCSTYGCDETPALEKAAQAIEQSAAWGDNKTCPICGESIKAIARRCRYCETDFDTTDPLTLHDLKWRAIHAEGQRALKVTAVVVFVLSILLPPLAPLVLVAGGCWVWVKRKELAAAGPLYLILGYSSIGLAMLFSMLILLFVMLHIFEA